MLIPYVLFLVGFIFMIKGGDLFVDGATWLAKITGLPEVLIGATIVSLATTLPETMVSVLSSIHNEPTMSMGNAVGSIICNTGLALGLCNIIKPSKVSSRIFYLKGIMLLLYIFILWSLASNGVIGHLSSFVLLSMLIVYILFNVEILRYKNAQPHKKKKNSLTFKEVLLQILSFFFGALFILIGANLLVDYGVVIAEHWNVPSAIISLTLISFGTSLPEFITSVSAIRKGHSALSMGNILGANILNASMVIGLSANFNPLIVSAQTLALDIPVAFILNFLVVIPAFFTRRITRPQASLIFLGYIVYIGFLFIHYL